jgi:prepilin-type N-terminal cleavage/methylation domain-containing protein
MRRRQRASSRGFTLIETMVVVLIIGVLATLAVYGVRKYVMAAKTSEPMEIINSIRAAQEAYKDETFSYKPITGGVTGTFPFANAAATKNQKLAWDSGTAATLGEWNELGVRPSSAVQFGYGCAAGKGTAVPQQADIGISQSLNYPATAPDWYVVRAIADRDGNGVYAYFVGSNFTDGIYGENESE